MRPFFLILLLALFHHLALADDKVDESMLSSGATSPKSVFEESNNFDKQSYAGLEDIFQDTQSISTHGKYMLLVFGKNGCSYCEMLKQDLKHYSNLRNYIKEHFSAYYINISYSKMHHFKIGPTDKPKETMLNTQDLSSIYDVSSTPTLVLADPTGKTIYELPGYMPHVQLLAVLEFVGKGLYKDLNDKQFIEKLRAYILKKTQEAKNAG
ncbi:SoxW family protein [Helicobacter ailurogastricus]|uniref:Thiol:disulfide interchange protein (DsbC), putative n=1 Tax=Helicobacter ailurogastricus TaxID=1578720 RepID=A0A0K2Y429_9HELI|nr:thioredoxin fold domain-containing protein [Helicobacter ailurogastricus]CRF51880.1 thiol:disulfide interchange protein (dsbC), putative [Helicobacter ailurogastricus]